MAAAAQFQTNATIVGFHQRAAIVDGEVQIREFERPLPFCEHQRIERAETGHAIAQGSEQARPYKADFGDVGQTESRRDQHLYTLHDQVWPVGIADYDIGEHLPAWRYTVYDIGGRYAALGQGLCDHIVGDPLALEPRNYDNRENQQDDEPEHLAQDATPAPAGARFNRLLRTLRHCHGHLRECGDKGNESLKGQEGPRGAGRS